MVTPLCLLLLLTASAGPTPFGERIPPVSLSDLGRFPTLGACEERVKWIKHHLEWVEMAESLEPDEVFYWWEYRLEVDRRQRCWESLRRARKGWEVENCWEDDRLDSLRELRDRLGLFDYYDGHMPWW